MVMETPCCGHLVDWYTLRSLGNGYPCPRLITITRQYAVRIVEGTTLVSVISTIHGQKATRCERVKAI